MNLGVSVAWKGGDESMLSHSGGCKAGQIPLFGLRPNTPSTACCPIEIEQVRQVEAIPEHAADQGEVPPN
jgi:hypothetical protein